MLYNFTKPLVPKNQDQYTDAEQHILDLISDMHVILMKKKYLSPIIRCIVSP